MQPIRNVRLGAGSVLVLLAVIVTALIHAVTIVNAQLLATADRVREPGWWPTKGAAPLADYVGPSKCAPCHAGYVANQSRTAMARTVARADRSEILTKIHRLTFENGRYSYEIDSTGQQPRYTVSDGTRSASVTLTWAFGVGSVGQSFLFEREGSFREARVSYFDSIHALHFTPGRAITSPGDLGEAMERAVNGDEIRRCFGCHTTASTAAGVFDPSRATPGVTCEACHGPGRAHVEAMQETPAAEPKTAILNPATLAPEASVDFCGACHATFWDVVLAGQSGFVAMRSQPYRLRSSKCWTVPDARLTCTACHDPHRPLVKETRTYDPKCLSCHVTAGTPTTADRAGHACPVATSECASCHMPKFEVPDMHREFTDHLIAIPRRK